MKWFPWILALGSLALAAAAVLRPPPPQAPDALAPPAAAPTVLAPQIDEAALRRAVAGALGERPDANAAPAGASPEPVDHALVAQRDQALEEGLQLVAQLQSAGRVEPDDKQRLLATLSDLDRPRADQLLQTYFEALNRGDIVVDGPPL